MTYWKNNTIPDKDYYAVIFCSIKSSDLNGYRETDDFIMDLAMKQDGFLGYESAGDLHEGIFISYWENIESIEKWKHDQHHTEAKKKGIAQWYDRFLSQICKVEHTHHFKRQSQNA